ncbi:uncharacterized protein ASPGLDRAFT_45954, partial [Aspergillus glaucus CBS 516.65]
MPQASLSPRIGESLIVDTGAPKLVVLRTYLQRHIRRESLMAGWWRRMLQGVSERGVHVPRTGGQSRQVQYKNRTISANDHM